MGPGQGVTPCTPYFGMVTPPTRHRTHVHPHPHPTNPRHPGLDPGSSCLLPPRSTEPDSQAGIAEQAGVTRKALYRLLGTDGNPTLDTLLGVVKALGVRLSVAV